MTSKYALLSAAIHTIAVLPTTPSLPTITGTGCSATAVVGAFVAVEKNEPLHAAASALAYYSYAAEVAGARAQGAGPGRFKEELLNALYGVTPEEVRENVKMVVRDDDELNLGITNDPSGTKVLHPCVVEAIKMKLMEKEMN